MRVQHTAVRTDAMFGTNKGSYMENVIFNSTGKKDGTESDTDNGTVVEFGDLAENEREVYYVKSATTQKPIGTVLKIENTGKINYYVIRFYSGVAQGIIASPEVMIEDNLDSLTDFYNAAGEISRAFRIHDNDQFSISVDGVIDKLAVGDEVIAENGKFKKYDVSEVAQDPVGELAFNKTKADYGEFGSNTDYYEGGRLTSSWSGNKCSVTGSFNYLKQDSKPGLWTDGYYFAFTLDEAYQSKPITIQIKNGNTKTVADIDWVCNISETKNEITVKSGETEIAVFDFSGATFKESE